MSNAPGYRKWPNHRIVESPLTSRVRVESYGEVLADSTAVIEVMEDNHPLRYYFPRADVRMERLTPSPTTSECPFKGTARYFHLKLAGRELADAVWSYESPYDEHAALKDRVVFYDDKYPEIGVQVE